ncbi:hypothetical protein CPAV1605_944 [seawater metagenome]|uniref:Histidine phosphatase superfamily (Branch 1) n=1 Tax=seawater metagenome TaxID=1561972 RepID=A0A5E8CKK5_9ZZZZ
MTQFQFDDMYNYIIILRHAKSSWKNKDCPDIDRILSKKGLLQCLIMDKWIQYHNIYPDIIFNSPSKRTFLTKHYLLNLNNIPTIIEEKLYNLSEEDFIPKKEDLHKLLRKIISKFEQDKNKVMIIGHNPLLESLVETLIKKKKLKERIKPSDIIILKQPKENNLIDNKGWIIDRRLYWNKDRI